MEQNLSMLMASKGKKKADIDGLAQDHGNSIDWIYKSHNPPVPYPTMHHWEQKCAHFCFQWCIVAYEAGALWDLWDWSIDDVVQCCMCLRTAWHWVRKNL